MKNASNEGYLESNLALVTTVTGNQPVLLFTKYSINADTPITVVNIPPFRFISVPKNQIR